MSLSKPKNGMFRKFKGVRTIIDKVDQEQYREMLPEVFDLHEIPLVSLFVVDYIEIFPWPMTRYQEGAAFLRCKYKGEEYWYIYTMPVTKRIPMWGGRRIGYPKYLADEIYLKQNDGRWIGKVTHENQCKLCLSFSAGLDRKPRETEKILINESSFFLGKSIILCPPGQGPAVRTTTLEHKVEANWNPNYGMVKIEVDAGEALDGLFNKNERYVGMYNEFTGGININPHQLKQNSVL